MARRTRRHALKGVGALLLGSSIAGCSIGEDDNRIEMLGVMEYDPDELTVPAGTTVVWENVGDVGHTVTAYEDELPDDAEYFTTGDVDSEEEARGEYEEGDPSHMEITTEETWDHTFETPGTYEYFCIPHESQDMTGMIEVTED